MFPALIEINWLSVLCAFAAYFFLGALWYMLLFPQLYKVSLGRANETLQNQSPLYVVGPAVCVLFITIVSAVLLSALQIESYGDAWQFAVIIGFGYLVANTVNIAINPNIPRPFLYGLITGSYHMVGITLVVFILTAMR